MLEVVSKMFTRRDPHRDAVLGLARIISRYDMVRLGYDEGITRDRRHREERHVAIGVWIFPCSADSAAADLNPQEGIPAVTRDLRGDGIGIMSPSPLRSGYAFLAAPDEEGGSWRFFKCRVCHSTKKPGNWYQIGMQVERTIDLDGPQRTAFRAHVNQIQDATRE